MNRSGYVSVFILLISLSICSSLPLGENSLSEVGQESNVNPVSLFVKESDELKDARQLPQKSLISRSDAILGEHQENYNEDESQRATVHRAVSENAPTAFVHSSLGEFKSHPNSLNKDTFKTQERTQPNVYHNQDTLDNFNQHTNTFVEANPDEHEVQQQNFNNYDNSQLYLNQQQQQQPQQQFEHQVPNFGLKEEDIIEHNDYAPQETPANEQTFSHINTNDNLVFDDTQYIIDNEGTEPEETDHSNSHIPQQEINYQNYFQNQFPSNYQEINSIPSENANEELITNHNFENSEDNQYVNIISQPFAGHIFNQNDGLDHTAQTKRENVKETQHPSNLFSQNSIKYESLNTKENNAQPAGQTFIQRLEPTLILSNVNPYKVESKEIPFSLLPLEGHNSETAFKQTPLQNKGAVSHHTFSNERRHESDISAPSTSSIENIVFPAGENSFFNRQNINNANIYATDNTEQHQTVDFSPSYLGQSLVEEESQVVPQGRSLKNYEPSQFTHRLGFTPGKLEGGFVPSSFFSEV